MPTPHIEAAEGDFAETVLMPGDPLRAKFIADGFLENVRQVNRVRNMLAFTGDYQGRRVSIMGGGMGIPSISLYAKELYSGYGVETIIRVGSCGGLAPGLALGDLIVANGAGTDSGVNRARFGGFDFAAVPDFSVLGKLVETAEARGIPFRVGPLFSADLFYAPESGLFDIMTKMGVLGVEMEAAGLFGCAAECGRRAAAVCAVSDLIHTGESLSSERRERGFRELAHLCLEAATAL